MSYLYQLDPDNPELSCNGPITLCSEQIKISINNVNFGIDQLQFKKIQWVYANNELKIYRSIGLFYCYHNSHNESRLVNHNSW